MYELTMLSHIYKLLYTHTRLFMYTYVCAFMYLQVHVHTHILLGVQIPVLSYFSFKENSRKHKEKKWVFTNVCSLSCVYAVDFFYICTYLLLSLIPSLFPTCTHEKMRDTTPLLSSYMYMEKRVVSPNICQALSVSPLFTPLHFFTCTCKGSA